MARSSRHVPPDIPPVPKVCAQSPWNPPSSRALTFWSGTLLTRRKTKDLWMGFEAQPCGFLGDLQSLLRSSQIKECLFRAP